jgi:hypothetical protein
LKPETTSKPVFLLIHRIKKPASVFKILFYIFPDFTIKKPYSKVNRTNNPFCILKRYCKLPHYWLKKSKEY